MSSNSKTIVGGSGAAIPTLNNPRKNTFKADSIIHQIQHRSQKISSVSEVWRYFLAKQLRKGDEEQSVTKRSIDILYNGIMSISFCLRSLALHQRYIDSEWSATWLRLCNLKLNIFPRSGWGFSIEPSRPNPKNILWLPFVHSVQKSREKIIIGILEQCKINDGKKSSTARHTPAHLICRHLPSSVGAFPAASFAPSAVAKYAAASPVNRPPSIRNATAVAVGNTSLAAASVVPSGHSSVMTTRDRRADRLSKSPEVAPERVKNEGTPYCGMMFKIQHQNKRHFNQPYIKILAKQSG